VINKTSGQRILTRGRIAKGVHLENLMWYSTVSSACQSEAGQQSLGTVLVGVQENPEFIAYSRVGIWTQSKCSLGPPESTSQTASRSVQPFCRDYDRYRQTTQLHLS